MIVHIVLLKIRRDVPQKEVERVFAELAGLQRKIPGGGRYSSPEGMQKGFTHAFSLSFKDAASRDVYLPHPEHEKVKKIVFAVLDGGLDGVIAFDYEA